MDVGRGHFSYVIGHVDWLRRFQHLLWFTSLMSGDRSTQHRATVDQASDISNRAWNNHHFADPVSGCRREHGIS